MRIVVIDGECQCTCALCNDDRHNPWHNALCSMNGERAEQDAKN